MGKGDSQSEIWGHQRPRVRCGVNRGTKADDISVFLQSFHPGHPHISVSTSSMWSFLLLLSQVEWQFWQQKLSHCSVALYLHQNLGQWSGCDPEGTLGRTVSPQSLLFHFDHPSSVEYWNSTVFFDAWMNEKISWGMMLQSFGHWGNSETKVVRL